jgi:hypothetical protein
VEDLVQASSQLDVQSKDGWTACKKMSMLGTNRHVSVDRSGKRSGASGQRKQRSEEAITIMISPHFEHVVELLESEGVVYF